jgi:hypothetical protein
MARPFPVVPVTMATLFSNSFMGARSLYFLRARQMRIYTRTLSPISLEWR